MKKFLLMVIFLVVVIFLIFIFTPLERKPKLHFLTGQAKRLNLQRVKESIIAMKETTKRKIKEIEQKLKEKEEKLFKEVGD